MSEQNYSWLDAESNDYDISIEDFENMAFLDFEASSLNQLRSYPIEVGYTLSDLKGKTYRIKPAPGWNDWDESSEAVHGIKRDDLVMSGLPVDVVASEIANTLNGKMIFVEHTIWDTLWCFRLLRKGGISKNLQTLSLERFVNLAIDERRVRAHANGMITAEQSTYLSYAAMSDIHDIVSERYPHTHNAGEDTLKSAALMRFVLDKDFRATFFPEVNADQPTDGAHGANEAVAPTAPSESDIAEVAL